MRLPIILMAGLFIVGPATANEPNCEDPQFQQEMNHCARLDFEAADRELNAVWKQVFPMLRRWDAEFPEDLRGMADAVLEAQRAWIKFRDAQCIAEGFAFRGGTMEPLIVSSCKAGLTRKRTGDLRELLREG